MWVMLCWQQCVVAMEMFSSSVLLPWRRCRNLWPQFIALNVFWPQCIAALQCVFGTTCALCSDNTTLWPQCIATSSDNTTFGHNVVLHRCDNNTTLATMYWAHNPFGHNARCDNNTLATMYWAHNPMCCRPGVLVLPLCNF
jgi:hypothetical protein